MEKSFQLEGKVALITGSMSGIGLATAKLFLKHKLKGLILLDVNRDDGILKELEDISNGAEILYRKCDVGDAKDLADAYNYAWNSFGYINLAVHSAGIVHEDDSHKIICINVGGVINGSMWLWNKMRKDTGGEGGTIINISSITGIVNTPVVPIYSATKQAVRSFGECIGNSFHYERSGVRVLTICPGVTNTALIANLTRRVYKELDEELDKLNASLTFQTAECVAKVILEVFENAESGTVWVSHRSLPAVHVQRNEQELIEAYFSK